MMFAMFGNLKHRTSLKETPKFLVKTILLAQFIKKSIIFGCEMLENILKHPYKHSSCQDCVFFKVMYYKV